MDGDGEGSVADRSPADGAPVIAVANCSAGLWLNQDHNGIRAVGERGNALPKMTFKALRNISVDPWRIGAIVAAALVLLHFEHARTT